MESKQLASKPVHPSPSSDHGHTAVPSKKLKHHHHHHHHSDGKIGKKEKHGRSDKHSKMIRPDGKTITVKKEPVTPVKKKPMISESESEDDIPLHNSSNHSSTTHSIPTTVSVVQKMEVSPAHTEVKKEKIKLSGAVKHGGHTSTSEDDVPLAQRKAHLLSNQSSTVQVKSEVTSSPSKMITPVKSHPPKVAPSSAPLPDRKKSSSAAKAGTKRKKNASQTESDNEDDDEDFKPSGKKAKKTPSSAGKRRTAIAIATPTKKGSASKKRGAVKQEATASPTKGGRKKKEEKKEVWKWWEEEPLPEGVKWLSLEHKGPYFAPPYERLPPHVKFVYNGREMVLSEKAEEAAGFFAKMLDHDYTKKDIFCNNFFQDWRKEMTHKEADTITDFEKCDFTQIHDHYKERAEQRKQMSKEEKAKLKEENERIVEEYGWCMIDHHKEKIGNFKTEPPSLFRGRGDHPKQGRIKKRIEAEDVIINIGADAEVPEPPKGHKWKAVQHDNKVTWLVSWTENIQGSIKYVMLNPTSRLKAEKDLAKYETARKLKECVERIREQYTEDWKSKEMKIRQRAVAVYFIDKLALRAGNEKDSDETADTVGCCSLRCEHIKLNEQLNGSEYVVEFDFLGKDSIRYYNAVPVERQVFKNLSLFMRDKEGGDDLFDRLNTTTLNKHLSELMPGLTAKVFRTYNASKTLQDQLEELTDSDDVVPSKVLSYNRANRAVAILCNHQRAPPKTFDQQMTNLHTKIQAKEDTISDTKRELKALKKEVKTTKDAKTTKKLEAKKKQLARLEEQLQKLEVQATDKQENKEIALGTSKLNYLDPRISVAWCKKWDVPIEKVYNKTQREKFAWAIDMATEDFVF